MSDVEVRVPDIGDFDDVDVIDVHVKPGDALAAEDPLITLETDKASMDVPAPRAGKVVSVAVKTGAKVKAGDLILTLAPSDAGASAEAPRTNEAPAPPAARAASPPAPRTSASRAASSPPPPPRASAPSAAAASVTAQPTFGPRLVVIGSGPGGYTAAFRAADLGLQVTLVERSPTLGGVCLNVGCIPSKALLHAARVIEEAHEMGANGIEFGAPKVDTAKLRDWKNKVVRQLTGGLDVLAKQRKVRVVRGSARFASPNQLEVERDGARETIDFDQCIIAAGSEPTSLPNVPGDPRIIDSTGALELGELPERMLVIGGGIIGLEMATVYDALGVQISVVELTKTLLPGCDRDLVKPLEKRISGRYAKIMLGTRVTRMESGANGITVHFEGDNAPKEPQVYGRVLVAVGRSANGQRIGAERAGVEVNERGLIAVDKQMRTNVPHIFAIGDIVGQPMLAHKATHEGKVAAEVGGGAEELLRRARRAGGRVHGSRGRVGRPHRGRREGARRRVREGHVPVGRERALADARPLGWIDETSVRQDDASAARRGHRRHERGRLDRRGRARDRDGRGRRRRRAHGSSASDVVGDDCVLGRGGRRHDHRSVHTEAPLARCLRSTGRSRPIPQSRKAAPIHGTRRMIPPY